MIETLTFSQCLTKVMQKHKLTANNLATLIGTRADLKHVLNDDATHNKRSSLYEKLKESKLFAEEDYKQLKQALDVSRLGAECFRFQKAIESILVGEPSEKPQEIVTADGTPVSTRFEHLHHAEKIEIICFNCCYHSLFNALKPLFEDPKRDITMRHYLQAPSDWSAAAEYVSSALPVIFDPRYLSYNRHPSVENQLPSLGGNMLFIRSVVGNEIIEQYFVIANNCIAHELSNGAASQLFNFVTRVLSSVKPEPIAIKEAYVHKMDFPSLCMTFLSHELNRATYSITNDLCFHQIPTDIAISAFMDKGIASDKEMLHVVERTLSIHEQRYQNQYCKKKHTYRIMTAEGCERFLSTGETTDHFIGFRPFTPPERKVIFQNMLDAARNNPCFVPLLLKEETLTHKYNLVCYEKLGVSIDVKDTDYNIDGGYNSVFLMYPAFTKQYMNYYLDILAGEKCYSKKESMEMLEKMFDSFLERYELKE